MSATDSDDSFKPFGEYSAEELGHGPQEPEAPAAPAPQS